MSGQLKIAVFASGNGSNFQEIVDQVREGKLGARIGLLVCDRPNAYVVERAHQAEVEVFAFRPKDYPSREAYEEVIREHLIARQIDLVVLAGYMRLLTDVLVKPYEGRMINIHPSLLPAFPGTKGIRDAYDYGVKVTGCTVHFVDSGMDTGPIIAQTAVPIEEGDTLESLEEKIHTAERCLYPQVIHWIETGKVRLNGRKTVIDHTERSHGTIT